VGVGVRFGVVEDLEVGVAVGVAVEVEVDVDFVVDVLQDVKINNVTINQTNTIQIPFLFI
jgi:hypothetical protein